MQLHPLYSSAPRRLTNGWKGKREIQKVFNFHIRTSVDSFTLKSDMAYTGHTNLILGATLNNKSAPHSCVVLAH